MQDRQDTDRAKVAAATLAALAQMTAVKKTMAIERQAIDVRMQYLADEALSQLERYFGID